MNELQVRVQQTPGEIVWNFEELKRDLAFQMDQCKSLVYTDENIGDAKKVVAELRKLDKAVDARRIEIKNKCLEPYQRIEDQAKELKALIADPIRLISEKVNDYETRRKAAKKEKIMHLMFESFADLPDDIRKRLECKAYDSRWENATTTEKAYKEAIQKAHDETVDALRLISEVDEDFKDQVMAVYKIDLNLTAAMMKARELQKQKDILMEKERQKREKEEAEKRAQEELLSRAEDKQPDVGENIAEKEEEPIRPATDAVEKPEPVKKEEKVYVCMLKITGTADQIQKTINYGRYLNAVCEVMKA